jgi:TPR repeat protein
LALRSNLFGWLVLAALVPQAACAQTQSLQAGQVAFDAANFGAAQHYWLQAANAGDPRAAFDLGLLYDLGEGVPESDEIAFRWYLRAANEGLADAQINVGVMYDSGRGVTANQTLAAIWYARAAVQGNGRRPSLVQPGRQTDPDRQFSRKIAGLRPCRQ